MRNLVINNCRRGSAALIYNSFEDCGCASRRGFFVFGLSDGFF